MNITKSSSTFNPIHRNTESSELIVQSNAGRTSNFSIVKRLLNLGLVIMGVIICTNLWISHTQHENIWYQQQTNQLGRSLAKLTAQLLVAPLLENNDQAIAQSLTYLTKDPYVTGASLYDNNGKLVQQQEPHTQVIAYYLDLDSHPITFIEDITSPDNEVIGYLRVILDEQKIMQSHFDYQKQVLSQFEVLLLVAAGVGGILMRAFYTIRYRQYRRR